jgi:hypothetical protein
MAEVPRARRVEARGRISYEFAQRAVVRCPVAGKAAGIFGLGAVSGLLAAMCLPFACLLQRHVPLYQIALYQAFTQLRFLGLSIVIGIAWGPAP